MPSFFGTKVLDPVSLDEVLPFLDREALFASRWQFRRGTDAEEWEALRRDRIEPLLARLLARARLGAIFTPRILYGYFRCEPSGNGLIVHGEREAVRLDFPRERAAPNRCLADWFPEGFVALLLATVGEGVAHAAEEEFRRHRFSEAFYLKGLAAELAEATAAFGHERVRRELGCPADQGVRASPGYPLFPDLFAQRKLDALLDFARIGVTLTETCQLVPEYSTSAIISTDPRAALFRP